MYAILMFWDGWLGWNYDHAQSLQLLDQNINNPHNLVSAHSRLVLTP